MVLTPFPGYVQMGIGKENEGGSGRKREKERPKEFTAGWFATMTSKFEA